MGLSCAIVINSYNYGRYLAQAVDSAFVTRAIVVVVDDGTDDSWNVLARYGDRVTTLRQENRGQAAAINAGVAAADADLLLLLGADDVVLPNRIDRVADVFRAVEVEWERHDMLYFDQRGTDGLAYRFSAAANPTREFAPTGRVVGSTSGLAFRKAFLDSVGPIPQSVFRIGADLSLLAAGSIAGGAVTLAEPLTFRRRHPEQATSRVPFFPRPGDYPGRDATERRIGEACFTSRPKVRHGGEERRPGGLARPHASAGACSFAGFAKGRRSVSFDVTCIDASIRSAQAVVGDPDGQVEEDAHTGSSTYAISGGLRDAGRLS
jgi:Glycosyl transferase family 2